MSCEVICCEISEILKVLVEDQNGRYLHKLFTFLSVNSKLDCYLAGYFEKILEMLFRNMTVLMMKFFNSSGLELLKLFLNHIDNYSIMQIVQRLMLPHIPFSNSPEMENISYEDMKDFYQCNWSYMVEACSLLFNRMFETDNAEIPLHISDLLITVLQLSPPETLVIKFLCHDECINKLLDFIVADHADMVVVGDPFISSASISLASISVLESLISRLFEASLPFESNGRDTEFEVEHAIRVKESIDSICSQIIHFIPKINSALRLYIDDNPCAQLFSQNKIFFNRLGHRGLQLIKLIESLNRLANAYVDNTFCENGIFKTCIDLFVLFEGNSLLHLSVQRILITIIEADNSRRTAQKNVLVDCDLFRIVMSKVKRSRGTEDVSPPPESDTGDHAKDETARTKIYSNHSSMIGNMILIAQALSVAFDSNANDSSSHHSDDAIGADIQEERESDIKPTDANAPKSLTSNWEKQIDESEQNDDKMGLDQVTADLETIKIYATTDLQTEQINTADTKPNTESEDLDPNSLRALVVDEDLISSWENFVEKTLRPILDHQIMGSYQPSNVLSNSPMQVYNLLNSLLFT